MLYSQPRPVYSISTSVSGLRLVTLVKAHVNLVTFLFENISHDLSQDAFSSKQKGCLACKSELNLIMNLDLTPLLCDCSRPEGGDHL